MYNFKKRTQKCRVCESSLMTILRQIAF